MSRGAMTDLKPCPFCGGEARMQNQDPDSLTGGYFIECSECESSTNLRFACGDDPRPLLVEQWNRRAALAAEQPQPEALIAEADATVDKLRALHKHTMGYEDACVARGAELVADALRARAESEAGHG